MSKHFAWVHLCLCVHNARTALLHRVNKDGGVEALCSHDARASVPCGCAG